MEDLVLDFSNTIVGSIIIYGVGLFIALLFIAYFIGIILSIANHKD